MSWYVVRRLLVLILGIMVILTTEFVILRVLPDDAMSLALPRSPSFDNPGYMDELQDVFGEPLYVQYVEFIGDMLTGDFHFSYVYERDVSDSIFERLGNTLVYFLASVSACLVLGSVTGYAIARLRSHVWRQLLSFGPVALLSVAVIAWAWVLQDLLAVRTELLPAVGFGELTLAHAALPAATMFLASLGWFALAFRDGHMRAAAASAPEAPRFRDGLFAAMPKVQLAVALSVCFIVPIEIWFQYRGIGFMMMLSIQYEDYFSLQATVFLFAIGVFLMNYFMETIVTLIRPKGRLDLYFGEDRPATVAAPVQPQPLPAESRISAGGLARVTKAYLRSPVGVLALVVFLGFVALAIVGPYVSSDEYVQPYLYTSTTLFLDGAAPIIAVSLVASLLALLVGMALGVTAGQTRPYLDWLVTGVMQGLLAIPIVCLVALTLFTSMDYRSVGYVGVGLTLSVPLAAVMTLLVCHGVVSSKMRMAPGRGESATSHLPSIVSWSLLGLKYVVPAAMVAVFICDFLSLTPFRSWGFATEWAFMYNMFITGEWGYILPPLIGMFLLVGSTFLMLDTLDRVVRERLPRPEACLPAPPPPRPPPGERTP